MALKADTTDRVLNRPNHPKIQKTPQLESPPSRQPSSYIAIMLGLLALTYALMAGLRTVADMDLGWQLATGRWIVQHHSIASTDVLSYTARGKEWIYPVLSQILLYCVYALGGYSLLSWLGAAACVGTVALQLRFGNAVTAFLAVIAVPLIAARTAPRAEMFTEVLFAAEIRANFDISDEEALYIKQVTEEKVADPVIHNTVTTHREDRVYLDGAYRGQVNGEIQGAYDDRGRYEELSDPKYTDTGGIFDIMAVTVIDHHLSSVT
jgi:hypothetical protein